MERPDIAKKLVRELEGLALASRTQKRCVFVAPIVDVLLGVSIDRSWSATETLMRGRRSGARPDKRHLMRYRSIRVTLPDPRRGCIVNGQ